MRRGGWNDAPDDWDARDGAPARARGRRRPADPREEYALDAAAASAEAARYGARFGGETGGERERDGFDTKAGGFMDAFEGARNGDRIRDAPGAGAREGKTASERGTRARSDDGLGDAFGPARFGSEADDWEL